MEPALQVCLLGSFRLEYSGVSPDTLKSSRLQALLAYILLHRQAPISRQTLSAIFWPDTSDAQSRTNLRNLLYQLRQALPSFDQFIRVDKNIIEWMQGSAYYLDVEEFEACLVMPHGNLVNKESLEMAVKIYVGDLLPDCYDEWILPIRQNLQGIYLNALEALAIIAEQAREYSTAIGYVRRLLALDPFLPGGNLQLVRLHALNGDRPAALKTYQAYKRLLALELGSEPEAEIRNLYERLLHAKEIPKISPTKSATTLVGRQLEWHKLLAGWYTAAAGRAQVVFVRGEAGIGKTRLVEEFVAWAQSQGIQTASAFCYAAEGNLSLDPLVTWLRALPLPKLEKTWMSEVGRLLPEVYEKLPGLPPPEPLREAWQRQRFFEGLARAVLAHQELILILEDSQWADQDTLEWLHYLLRFAPQARLLVIATLRSGVIAADHPLLNLRQTLKAGSRCLDLDVHPLDADEAYKLALLTAQTGAAHRLSREAAVRISRKAEGNPLFIIEMVRLGLTVPDMDDAAVNESEMIQVILEQRLNQLNPATFNLMALAATIGRAFSLEVLLEASSESDEAVLIAIDELLLRKIIREIAPVEYDFTHDLLRKAAFQRLSTAHRRLLHRRVAEAYLCLEEKSPRPKTRSAEIASHFEQAGLLSQAVQQYSLAAGSAARLFANAEVQNFLERAVGLTDLAGITAAHGSADLAGLLERLGDVLVLNGKYASAVAAFDRCLSLPQVPYPADIWRSQIYRKMSGAWAPLFKHEQAHTALDKAEQLMRGYPDTGGMAGQQEWIKIQLARLELYYFDNHPNEMKVIIEKLGPLIGAAGQLDQQLNLVKMEIYMLMRQERFRPSDGTVSISWRRLALAEQFNEPFELALAQFQHGFLLLWHDELAAAQDWLQRGYEGLTQVGNTIWRVRALTYLTTVRRKLGQIGGLQTLTRQLMEEAEAINEPTYIGIGLANLGWLAWNNGDSALAVRYCSKAREAWSMFGTDVFHSLSDWVLLAASVQAQDLPGALRAAEYLLDPDPTLQPLRQLAADLLGQALQACRAGEGASAFALFNQALAEARATHEL